MTMKARVLRVVCAAGLLLGPWAALSLGQTAALRKANGAETDEELVVFDGTSGQLVKGAGLTLAQMATQAELDAVEAAAQPLDGDLTSLAALTTAAYGRSLLETANEAAFKALVNLEAGTDVQAFHAYLADIAGVTGAQGNILYFNGTDWVVLAPGTNGHFLQTQGAGANPQWASASGSGDMLAATYDAASVEEQLVGLTATQTLTNKTLTAPVLGGTVTGTYTIGGTPTFPSTVVSTTGTQTLTNKTLTSPTITGANHLFTAAAMGALEIDVTKTKNTKSISGAATMTFSSDTPTTGQVFGVTVKNTAITDSVLTLSSATTIYSENYNGARTTVTIPASGQVTLGFWYDGSQFQMSGDPVDFFDDIAEDLTPTDSSVDSVAYYDAATNAVKRIPIDDLLALGGGGSGTLTTIKENNTQVGGADIVTLDFLGADFDLAESPDTEIQVVVAAAIARDAEVDAAYGSIAGETWTGTHNFGGAVFELPNGTSGTTDATGEAYLDTNGDGGTNFSGPVIQVYDGSANKYLFPVALPLAASQNDYILKYDSTGKTVQWEADSGAGGGIANVVEDTTPTLGGELDGGAFDIVNLNSLILNEQASENTPGAGKGRYWVINSSPSRPRFTDDAGSANALLHATSAPAADKVVIGGSGAGGYVVGSSASLSTTGVATGFTIDVGDNTVRGAQQIHTASDTLTTDECYGKIHYVSSAATLTLPAAADGMHLTVITIGATAVSVDVNASDLMYLDGTALDDGDKATNTSTAGDIIVFTYYDATGWYAASNGWTDGGP